MRNKYVMTDADEKMVNILRLTKKIIADEGSNYVCLAINIVYEKQGREECSRLKAWISDMLGEYTMLEEWVSNNTKHESTHHIRMRRMRRIRLQWIDAMIHFIKTNSWEIK